MYTSLSGQTRENSAERRIRINQEYKSIGVPLGVLPFSGSLRRTIGILVPVGISAALGFWYFTIHQPPIPQRPLRIGFENLPPDAIRTDSGFAGPTIEIVSEAAKRAGIAL